MASVSNRLLRQRLIPFAISTEVVGYQYPASAAPDAREAGGGGGRTDDRGQTTEAGNPQAGKCPARNTSCFLRGNEANEGRKTDLATERTEKEEGTEGGRANRKTSGLDF